jgi:hypothetical protein
MRWAIVTVALLTTAGCRWGTVDRADFENEYGSVSAIPAIGRSFFSPENARALPALLERAIGGRVIATVIRVEANRLFLTAFDPKNADELNDYYYLDGGFQKPTPTRVTETSRRESFDIRDVPFERLPEMVRQARAEFAKWKGITASVTIDRAVPKRVMIPVSPKSHPPFRRADLAELSPETKAPGQGPLRIRVLCNAPRGSGTLELDAQGQVRSAQ